MSNLNFYEVLNVKSNATEKDIKKAYRTLAKKYHPDTYEGNKDFAEAKMQEINIAYDTLSNSNSRKEYDIKIGVNIKETYEQPIKNTSYYKSDYRNRYDKDGVNYEVKYRPNNKNIKYDSNGYAESNYYTYEKDDWRTGNSFSFKELKQKLAGKNLAYTVTILIVAVGIVSFSIYKAVESMNEFLDSAKSGYNKVNSVNVENAIKTPTQNTNKNLEEELYPVIENAVNDIKSGGKEILDKYKQKNENKSREEILNDWGITDSEDQKVILDYLDQFKKNN